MLWTGWATTERNVVAQPASQAGSNRRTNEPAVATTIRSGRERWRETAVGAKQCSSNETERNGVEQ